jgi:1-acyl-sn-glycerol-3-phosphate acyltransferase
MHMLVGILSTTLVVGNVVVNCIPLFLMGIVRVAVRLAGLDRAEQRIARWMDLIIDSWVVINRGLFALLRLTRVEVTFIGDASLTRDRWYMVISNHQSWTDILILQTQLFHRIPPLKFFTKRQLLWVPFLGQAMWLLDFPYVRRMSREQIAANPELLEVDRQATLKACEKFKGHPTSALNFLEGTRFTAEKYAAQEEPRYRHLLNPKVGGLTQVLIALEDRLDKVVDVTISYPEGVPSFWSFMQGRCPRVVMRVDCRDVPPAIRDAEDADARRTGTAEWVDALWQEKDERLAAAGAG